MSVTTLCSINILLYFLDALQEQEPPQEASAAMVPSIGQSLVSAQNSNGHATSQVPGPMKEQFQPRHNVEFDSGVVNDPSTAVIDQEPYISDPSSQSCTNDPKTVDQQHDSISGPIPSSNAGDGIHHQAPSTNALESSDNVHSQSSTPTAEFPSGAEEQQCHSDSITATEPDPAVHTDSPGLNSGSDVVFEVDSDDNKSDSSLLSTESGAKDKGQLVLSSQQETAPHTPDLVEQLESLTLGVQQTQASCNKLKADNTNLQWRIKEKDDMIKKLEEEKEEADKRYQEEIRRLKDKREMDETDLKGLKSHAAELEKKLQEKDKESEHLRESLRRSTASAERTDLQFQSTSVLQDQINTLTEQLDREKKRAEQKEWEIAQLENQLLQKELDMEKKDNFYKDQVRAVEKERDEIRVELERTLRKQEEEKCRMREEENHRLLEKIKLLEGQLQSRK